MKSFSAAQHFFTVQCRTWPMEIFQANIDGLKTDINNNAVFSNSFAHLGLEDVTAHIAPVHHTHRM